jgi:hypothetical protein
LRECAPLHIQPRRFFAMLEIDVDARRTSGIL